MVFGSLYMWSEGVGCLVGYVIVRYVVYVNGFLVGTYVFNGRLGSDIRLKAFSCMEGCGVGDYGSDGYSGG